MKLLWSLVIVLAVCASRNCVERPKIRAQRGGIRFSVLGAVTRIKMWTGWPSDEDLRRSRERSEMLKKLRFRSKRDL